MTDEPEQSEMSPQEVAELRRLARSRPRSGRGQTAKLGAIRTLERLDRDARSRAKVVPPMPSPDWYPPGHEAMRELDEAYLEAHPAVRQRMWEAYVTKGAFPPLGEPLARAGARRTRT